MIDFFLDIPRIFLGKKKIYVPRIFLENGCIFLRVNVTFGDAVNMIHDVMRKPNPFSYTDKFMFVDVR